MIEVIVESIRVNMTSHKRVVMLKEKHGPRYLPIWIGHFEADAIAIPMQKVPINRPLTHDMLVNTISQLGGRCTTAVIARLERESFYAILIVDQGGRHVEIDCRPSDAISAAIRARAPIYVDESVMDVAGKVFTPEDRSSSASGEGASAVAQAEDIAQAADGSAASPVVDAPDETGGDPSETIPYWPGAEPAAGPAPSPFNALHAVSAPVLASLQRTQRAVVAGNRSLIGPGELLLGLLRQQDAAANRVLADLNVDVDELYTLVRQRFTGDRHPVMLTPAAQAVLLRAQAEATRLDEDTVGAEHLLLALAGETDGSVQAALEQIGLTQSAIRRQVAVLLAHAAEQDEPPS